MKRLIGLALAAAATLAHAQNTAIPGVPASAAKKELVQRLLNLQQNQLDGITRDVVARPAQQIAAMAEEALQTQVPPAKHAPIVKKIQESLQKYEEGTMPLVRDRAGKIGQTSVGPFLEEKFTEDELRQLVTSLEAPAFKKFQQTQPELLNLYVAAVRKDLATAVQPKIDALERDVRAALGVQAPASAPTGAAAPKPAKK
jgi:hypothetical protein